MNTQLDLTERERVLYGAIQHVLNLRQTNPDLGYLICPMSGAFERLCEAEAMLRGETVEETSKRRSQDLQPAHNKHQACVVTMRAKLEQIERLVDEVDGLTYGDIDLNDLPEAIRQILLSDK